MVRQLNIVEINRRDWGGTDSPVLHKEPLNRIAERICEIPCNRGRKNEGEEIEYMSVGDRKGG